MKVKNAVLVAFIAVFAVFISACNEKVDLKNDMNLTDVSTISEPNEPEVELDEVISAAPAVNASLNTTDETGPPINITPVVTDEPVNEPDLINEETVQNNPQANQGSCQAPKINNCAGLPKLTCTGSAVNEIEERKLTFTVKNQLGMPIVLNDFYSYDEEEPWQCMTRFSVENVEVSIDGSPLVSIDSAPTVNDGSTVDFVVWYSEPDRNYIDQKFTLVIVTDKSQEVYFLITA